MSKLDVDPRLPNVGADLLPRLVTRLYEFLRQVASAANGHEDGYVHKVVATTVAYTVQRGDGTILANAAGAAFAVTLQAAAEHKGKVLFVRKTEGSANNVTVTPPAGLIDGAATLVLNAAGPRATVVTDGTNFFTV